MILLLSPAKKLDYEIENLETGTDQPPLLKDAETLAAVAKKLKPRDFKSMMGISDALADLNAARFKDFTTPFKADNDRPAMDA